MLLSQSAWEKKNSKHLSRKKLKRLTGRSNVNCKQKKIRYYICQAELSQSYRVLHLVLVSCIGGRKWIQTVYTGCSFYTNNAYCTDVYLYHILPLAPR